MNAVRAAVRTLGELLFTSGLIVLLFVAYELWGTGIETARAQSQATKRIEAEWRKDAPDPVPVVSGSAEPSARASGKPSADPSPAKVKLGTNLAIIRVPRFGKGYSWIIGEGTGREQLKKGPGHYRGTELPGQVGNFVVSGHRTTYRAPFNKVDLLRAGDAIVIETRSQWFTYRVTNTDIVRPDQVEVALPVPYKKGVQPTKKLITLTSCHPKFSARQRIIVFGEMESFLDKAGGKKPPALAEA